MTGIRWNLYLSSVLTCLLYYMPLGYFLDIVNNPEQLISGFMIKTFEERYGTPESYRSSLWTGVVALLAVGQLIGTIIAPFLSDKFGRKWTLSFIVCPLGLLCGIMFLLSKYANCPELLFVSRLFSGVRVGMSCTVLATFLMEFSPNDVRGALGSLMDFTACCGVFVSFMLSQSYVFGTKAGWVWLLSIDLWLGLIGLASFFYLHESPKYLCMVVKDMKKTEASLRFYHGSNVDTAEVIQEYKDEDAAAKHTQTAQFEQHGGEKRGVVEAEKHLKKRYRQIYILSALVGFIPPACGYMSIGAYSNPILRKTGLSDHAAELYALVMGGSEICGGSASMLVNHRAPRRLVLLTVTGIIVVCDIVLAVTLSLGQNMKDDPTNMSGYIFRNAGAICFLFMAVLNTIGPYPLSAIIPSELAPIEIRAKAASICIGSMSVGFIITQFTLYPLFLRFNAWVFIACGVVTAGIFVYLYKYLDETNPEFVKISKTKVEKRPTPADQLADLRLMSSNEEDSDFTPARLTSL